MKQREKFSLNKIEYYLDSVPEAAKDLIGDIKTVEIEMEKIQLQYNINKLAKEMLLTKLQGFANEFEKVETEKTETEKTETEKTETEKTEKTEKVETTE